MAACAAAAGAPPAAARAPNSPLGLPLTDCHVAARIGRSTKVIVVSLQPPAGRGGGAAGCMGVGGGAEQAGRSGGAAGIMRLPPLPKRAERRRRQPPAQRAEVAGADAIDELVNQGDSWRQAVAHHACRRSKGRRGRGRGQGDGGGRVAAATAGCSTRRTAARATRP